MDRPHNVPKLLIKLMHQQTSSVQLLEDTIRIGRSEDCEAFFLTPQSLVFMRSLHEKVISL